MIANPQFGFLVAAEGSGYTWARNSRENQLTPWSNDPVSDRPGEVLYVRDEESGELWGPTATPIRDPESTYSARHGQGYSRFEHSVHGIELELLMFVPVADPVKISRLRIRNVSARAAPTLRHRLCRVRARRRPQRDRALHHYLRGHRERCTDGLQSLGGRLRRRHHVRGSSRPAELLDLRSARVYRPSRHSGQARGARRAHRRCRSGWVRGWIRVAPCRRRVELEVAETIEIVFLLGEAAASRGRRRR